MRYCVDAPISRLVRGGGIGTLFVAGIGARACQTMHALEQLPELRQILHIVRSGCGVNVTVEQHQSVPRVLRSLRPVRSFQRSQGTKLRAANLIPAVFCARGSAGK